MIASIGPPLLPGALSPATAALWRNPADRDHGASVGSRQASGPGVLGSVFSGIGSHGDVFAGCDQGLEDTPVITVSPEDIGCWHFQGPIYDPALLVLGVEVNPSVRVVVQDLGDFSYQREWLRLVILGLKRV